MRKLLPIVLGLATAGLLSACGSNGVNRQRPDEFAVARQAPLVIPPDFSLVPPQPGAVRAQDNNPADQALDALFGGTAPRSASESGALSNAGRDTVAPGVRSEAGSPNTQVVDKGATTRDVVAAPEGDGRDARVTTPN
ncbi:MAG: DUF3035 domain-containing protein [Pseudomonadota bacterium]